MSTMNEMQIRTSNTARTAIRRNKLSKPAYYLRAKGLLRGRVLDYGCGRGDDVRILGTLTPNEISGYDPNHECVNYNLLDDRKYDTIMCNYVLNVIESKWDRNYVIDDIIELLETGGVGYISVRNDRNALKGATKIGTWQGFIDLDLPVETVNSNFIMYRVTAENLRGEYHKEV